MITTLTVRGTGQTVHTSQQWHREACFQNHLRLWWKGGTDSEVRWGLLIALGMRVRCCAHTHTLHGEQRAYRGAIPHELYCRDCRGTLAPVKASCTQYPNRSLKLAARCWIPQMDIGKGFVSTWLYLNLHLKRIPNIKIEGCFSSLQVSLEPKKCI